MTKENPQPMNEISKLMQEASDELTKEIKKKYKTQIKEKMKCLTKAKRIVSNLEGELEDLGIQIAKELS